MRGTDNQSKPLTLTEKDQKKLTEYVYSSVYDYLDGKKASHDDKTIAAVSGGKKDRLYLSIYYDNNLRGCQSIPISKKINTKQLNELVYKTMGDARFKNEIPKDQIDGVTLSFDFLSNRSEISSRNIDELKDIITLGINPIQISNGEKSAYFIASVPITKNYQHKTLLEQLCKKAGLESICYQSDLTQIYKFDSFNFVSLGQGKPPKVYYRFNPISQNIDEDVLRNRLELVRDWFKTSYNSKKGIVEYEYYPSKNKYSDDVGSHTRELATIWAMTYLDEYLGNRKLKEAIDGSIQTYSKNIIKKDNYAYFKMEDGSNNIAYSAFMVMSLLNTKEENQNDLIEPLINGILSRQTVGGYFYTNFESETIDGQDYYPGEALLALMHYYENTEDKKVIDVVMKAFPSYVGYWRGNKNTAFVPWHSKAYKILYEYTRDQKYAEFVFEMNDWLLNNHQVESSPNSDLIGGFNKPNPTISTSVYLEGLADAYSLAVKLNDANREKKYRDSIRLATNYLLKLQFTEENSFYLDAQSRALGGFKSSLTKNNLRIDNAQHAVFAISKIIDNDIFNK